MGIEMANRDDQTTHDSMVKYVANHVSRQGHSNIRADIAGYTTPDLIYWGNSRHGHVPDVTSCDGSKYIIEVETADSIADAHTVDQWRLFSSNAAQHAKKFIVVVPEGYHEQAWKRALQLSVKLEDVWVVGEITKGIRFRLKI
jgi:hypothetical protein